MGALSNHQIFDLGPPTGPSYQFTVLDPDRAASLRDEFTLEKVIPPTGDDLERLMTACRWVHTRWEHDGGTSAETNDAAQILREAAKGRQFRCVEYSCVLSGVLTALGYPSRPLGLMTAEVETVESCAGHVVTETYLPSFRKWVMLDAQCDAIPFLKGVPLNAVELALALHSEREALLVSSSAITNQSEYLNWIAPYLYFFTVTSNHSSKQSEVARLRLAPIGARNPKTFQRVSPMPPAVFTHSVAQFYADPS